LRKGIFVRSAGGVKWRGAGCAPGRRRSGALPAEEAGEAAAETG